MDMAILKRQILIDAVIYEGSVPPTKLKHFISEANELGMKGVQNFFDSRLTVGDVTLYMGEDDIYIDFFFSNNGKPDAPDVLFSITELFPIIDKCKVFAIRTGSDGIVIDVSLRDYVKNALESSDVPDAAKNHLRQFTTIIDKGLI